MIRILIADAEITYLASCMQAVEGSRHLIWLHKGIGPMQEQDVQIVGLEALENAVHRIQNMLAGKVKISFWQANPTFGLD